MLEIFEDMLLGTPPFLDPPRSITKLLVPLAGATTVRTDADGELTPRPDPRTGATGTKALISVHREPTPIRALENLIATSAVSCIECVLR